MDIAILKTQWLAQKKEIVEQMLNSKPNVRNMQRTLGCLTNLIDDVLIKLWKVCEIAQSCTLVAVGGFGRKEQFVHSDVDVLVLLDEQSDIGLAHEIESFISLCWDVGLEIGSSVRTVSQCLEQANQDISTQTALLEMRRVAGNEALYRRLNQSFFAHLNPLLFFQGKMSEMRQRHHQYGDTPYALEPNCKESPGGLRDLQIILWVAKAAHLGGSWAELERNGLATKREVYQLRRNEALLQYIRFQLHCAAKRREDRLIFDLQAILAQEMIDSKIIKPSRKGTMYKPSEQLMSKYYWAAKAVRQLNQILLLNIEERLQTEVIVKNLKGNLSHLSQSQDNTEGDRKTIYSAAVLQRNPTASPFFYEQAGALGVYDLNIFIKNPRAILQTFLLYQTTLGCQGLAASTLRALYNARPVMNANFRHDSMNANTFMQILKQPQGITHALRLMNETSVLGRYLWVFRRIVGQMQHDLFHVYTVDQHTLTVVRNMRRFFMVEHMHEYPFCSQLAADWDKPWVLFIAAFFHDIAKGRGGDHSVLGATEVRRFCKKHAIEKEDTKLIEFLVREHLTLSRVAQKEDLSDIQVIQNLAKRVGNERYLTALYLLTVADIRATGPTIWNAWKGKLLEDAYRLTALVLGGHQPSPDAEIERVKKQAREILAFKSQPYQSERLLWSTFDVSYFMRHDAQEIAWHTRHLSRCVDQNKTIVQARPSPLGEGLQVMVYTPTVGDLFARICAYFDKARLNILDAKIYTTLTHYALDTFQVHVLDTEQDYRILTSMVELDLLNAISGKTALLVPAKTKVSRRARHFPSVARAQIRPDERAQRWILTVSASDRTGLLYGIAYILAQFQVSVISAKIITLGERVEDIFIIDGIVLHELNQRLHIEALILEALQIQ